MGFVGKIEKVTKRERGDLTFQEVKYRQDGREPRRGDLVGPSGDDSPPLDTDYALAIPLEQTGRTAAAAFYDPKNPSEAEQGEKRIFARDEDGKVVCVVWLRADGSVEISNEDGKAVLGADGSFEVETPGGNFGMDRDGNFSAEVSTLSISNDAGSLKLDVDGVWTINSLVTINAAGVVKGTDFVAGVIKLLTHLHDAGTYLDSHAVPVTGKSGAPTT